MTPYLKQTGRIGPGGTLVIPAALRRRFGLGEGSELVVEETAEGILLRPALTLPVEMYSPQRRAELLLSNAVGEDDYRRVRDVIREMGVDPDLVQHERA
jgi:AbrB family looped-hinge helix DNA binding protein